MGKGAEMKLGYFFASHNDIGVILGLGFNNNVQAFKFDKKKKGDNATTNSTDARVALYYNYDFAAKGWLMPYVGPYFGLDYMANNFKQGPNKDNSSLVSPLAGLEAGIKFFPIKNAFVDLGANFEIRSSTSTSKIDSDPSIKYAGFDTGIGAFMGLGLYFQ